MAINIGKRREPLWDYFLVDKDKTTATLSVNSLKREFPVFQLDAPWDGNGGYYPTVIHDGYKYNMYFGTGRPTFDRETGRLDESKCRVCKIESYDGLFWKRPTVDKFTYEDISHNNIVLMHDSEPRDCLAVFIDNNPDCPDSERYKGILRVEDGCKVFSEGGALACFVSSDGNSFERGEDLLREGGKFDSLNTAFYDEIDGEYKLFHRDFLNGKRAIRYRVSKDFKHWEDRGFLEFDDDEVFQLYTNNIRRYHRAPHVYIGLPVRYTERKAWTENYDQLPNPAERRGKMYNRDCERCGLAMTDTLFMSSRDGLHWSKFNEAFFDSGVEDSCGWFYGRNYLSHGYVTIDERMYFYEIERRIDDKPPKIWANSIRVDGFASFKADYKGATLTTKPFVFEGEELYINFRTSAAGRIYVTIADEEGNSKRSIELFGNNIDARVPFGKSLTEFAGKNVTLTFDMRDAEMFSFKFE